MQVVYTAEEGWPQVRLAAGGLRVQEFQDQPQGTDRQPGHQAPKGPLGKGEAEEDLKGLSGHPSGEPHGTCLCYPPAHWPSSRRCPGRRWR